MLETIAIVLVVLWLLGSPVQEKEEAVQLAQATSRAE